MTTGELLRKARRKLKKTQKDIADEVARLTGVGCTQVAVQGWESGKWLPEALRMRAVAEAYAIDPLVLLPKKQTKKRKAA